MKTLIRNASMVTPFEIKNGCVLFENGKILEAADNIQANEAWIVLDAGRRTLTPGFIDIHIHGGGRREAMEGTEDAIITMANTHAAHGTTTVVPTTTCGPLKKLEAAIDAVRKAMKSPGVSGTIAGIHLEGPYLNEKQAGAQPRGSIFSPSETSWNWMLDNTDIIRMVGLAPELPGAFRLAEALRDRGVTVSAAHSDADFDCIRESVKYGVSDVTHIYSACSTVKRVKGFRVAGLVEAGLLLPELTVQIIADGCHLPDALINLVYRCKGAEKVEMITDALYYSCAEPRVGEVVYDTAGTPMIYKDGVMKMPDESAFCGSVATTDRLLRTAVKAGIPLKDAVRMLTDTPARRIGLTEKGRIQKGYDADFVLLDGEMNVDCVIARGRIISGGIA